MQQKQQNVYKEVYSSFTPNCQNLEVNQGIFLGVNSSIFKYYSVQKEMND